MGGAILYCTAIGQGVTRRGRRVPQQEQQSVVEQPHTRKRHNHAELVRGLDNLVVPDGSARLGRSSRWVLGRRGRRRSPAASSAADGG